MKKSKFLFLFLVFGLGLLLGMSACKSAKKQTLITLPEKNKNERLDLILEQSLQYETFSSSLNFTFKQEKGKNISVDGQLKMIKDQAIQLSLKIPFLGTEAFRMTVTPEQIIVIDRINKRYMVESMEDAMKKASFDFDFYGFQALLSNQLFIAGKNQVNLNDYPSFRIQEEPYFARIENTDKYNIRYVFTSDYTNRILTTQIYNKEEESAKISWVYENFGLTNNKQLFPMLMKMDVNHPKNPLRINFTFNTVNINNTFELDYSYPSKYKRIGLQDVVKLIENLL